ncbi:MAG: hypothetical protein ACI4U3_05525 [Traorella sp.]
MKNQHLKISLIAIGIGLLVAFLLTALTFRNPYDLLCALIRSMSGVNLQNITQYNYMYILNCFLNAVPIVLTGLSVAFAFRSGLFNIGGEG